MTTEIVYLGHDNTIDLLLKADDEAQDLSLATRITATFNDGTFIDSDDSSAPITWAESAYDTGEIRIDVGGKNIEADFHKDVPIIVYDSMNPNGILWGYINVDVIADPEGS